MTEPKTTDDMTDLNQKQKDSLNLMGGVTNGLYRFGSINPDDEAYVAVATLDFEPSPDGSAEHPGSAKALRVDENGNVVLLDENMQPFTNEENPYGKPVGVFEFIGAMVAFGIGERDVADDDDELFAVACNAQDLYDSGFPAMPLAHSIRDLAQERGLVPRD